MTSRSKPGPAATQPGSAGAPRSPGSAGTARPGPSRPSFGSPRPSPPSSRSACTTAWAASTPPPWPQYCAPSRTPTAAGAATTCSATDPSRTRRSNRPRRPAMLEMHTHYQLNREPFTKNLTLDMLHHHHGHDEAAARITWCISQGAIGVITGEAGAGKTAAARAAIGGIDRTRHHVIYIARVDRALDAGQVIGRGGLRVADRVLLEALVPHPPLGVRHAQRGGDEHVRPGQQRGGLVVEPVGMLEAADALGERLPDRHRLTRMRHHVGVV